MAAPVGEAGSHDPNTWVEYTQALLDAPGVDPLLMVDEQNARGIPDSGFLITACVTPGRANGLVGIESYAGIGLGTIQDHSDHGRRMAGYWLYGSSVSAKLLCGSTDKLVLQPDRGEFEPGTVRVSSVGSCVTELSAGRVVVARPSSVSDGSDRPTNLLASYNPLRDLYVGEHPEADTEIVRAVATPEEAADVLAAVGRGMGLRHDDFEGFMNAGIDQIAAILAGDPEGLTHGRLHEPMSTDGGAQWMRRLGALTAAAPDNPTQA